MVVWRLCIASLCIDQGDMTIDSQSDADCALAQALLHDLGVDSHRDQDGSGCFYDSQCTEIVIFL